MESKKRRHFPDAFKREAVDRARTSGLAIIQVAEELGLHETVLRRWIRRFDRPETRPARRPITQVQGSSPRTWPPRMPAWNVSYRRPRWSAIS